MNKKQLIQECKDFCKYGWQVLDEETAKEYLHFLASHLNEFPKIRDVTYNDAKGSELSKKICILNKERFKKELLDMYKHQEPSYFMDDGTIEAFKDLFEKMLVKLKTTKASNGSMLNSAQLGWLRALYTNYISRFESGHKGKEVFYTQDFRKYTTWDDK